MTFGQQCEIVKSEIYNSAVFKSDFSSAIRYFLSAISFIVLSLTIIMVYHLECLNVRPRQQIDSRTSSTAYWPLAVLRYMGGSSYLFWRKEINFLVIREWLTALLLNPETWIMKPWILTWNHKSNKPNITYRLTFSQENIFFYSKDSKDRLLGWDQFSRNQLNIETNSI